MGKVEITGFLSGLAFLLTFLGLTKEEGFIVVSGVILYSFIGIILAMFFPVYFYKKGVLTQKEAEYLSVILSMVWIFYVYELFKLVKQAKR